METKKAPPTEPLARLQELIRDVRIAMLTTRGADGKLRSRPMRTQDASPGGDLWFFTSTESAKAEDIADNQEVNLSYVDEEHERFISVSGRAALVHDAGKANELWRVFDRAWFPGGPEDAGVALIRVTVEEAQYWDARAGKLVQLSGFLKALVTGKPFESATIERLERGSGPGATTEQSPAGDAT